MKTSAFRAAGICALLAGTALCAPALAQSSGNPSIHKNIDENGVDLTDGSFNFSLGEGSIGSGQGRISLMRYFGTGGQQDNLTVAFYRSVSGGQANISLIFGNRREEFTGASGAASFTSAQGTGASLTKSSASDYVYTADDGTVTTYAPPPGLTNAANNGFCSTSNETSCDLVATQTVEPNGATTSYEWDTGENCTTHFDNYGEPYYDCAQFWRQRGLSNSFGYSARFGFQQESNPPSGLPGSPWHTRSGATLSNNGASPRTVSYASPSSTITDVTTDGGRTWRFTRDSQQRVIGIRRPGSASDNISVAYAGSTSLVVSQVTVDGVTTYYSRSVSGSTGTMTRTDALSGQRVVVSDLTNGRPTSDRDELNRTTSFAYDASGRLTLLTAPEGNAVSTIYDSRGNVITTTNIAKPGSGLANITATAAYSSSCTNQKVCNKPTSTTDARGNTTDYSFDATHGGVLSVTRPAVPNGVRPQTRYGYTLTNGEYLLTSVSACQTASSCAGGADEVKTTLAYDANGNVTSSAAGSGNGALTAANAMTWDAAGNLLTVDGPLSGTADTVRYRYNAAREVIGTVSADPDGAGALKDRAVRKTIDGQGLVTKVENGTVNSQSDADWAAFAPLEAVEIAYDSNARPVTQQLTSSGTAYALTQTSYDALGRPACAAQRMNTSVFGSLPSSACTLGTQGSFGPDRIVKTSYDAAGQVVEVETAFGTADQAKEIYVYHPNGQLYYFEDGNGNQSVHQIDGHDRLSVEYFPSKTTSHAVNWSDLQYVRYDAASNVTFRQLRDGQVINYSYDNLNRLSAKDLPGSEPDVSYGYDNLGRMISASQSGNALSFGYDALGRRLTQAGPHGTVTSAYDIAGNRTRITHPDGFYVDQDFLVTGEMTKIREYGATTGVGVLATFAYDDLGRRTSLTRGNGTTASYAYDAASRLASLTENLTGTSYDQTLGFSYNPAGQITGNTRANDAYAWAGHGSGSTASTANGLNQLASAGGVTPAYDARGNMTYDGVRTLGYSSENLLAGATGGVTLAYDPLSRLYQTGGAATARFAYDGSALFAEYDGGNALQRRYVHGPGTDEPLVWYEGPGTSGRRFLHADERGSIVAVSDSTGTVIGINKYDEYGKPAASNIGRFQYTGQAWLPELQLYYYKNRMYHPNLGRFLQPDPIGYGDGLNLYNYVGSDPVNKTDPTGMKTPEPTRTGSIIPGVSPIGAFSCSGNCGIAGGSFYTVRGGREIEVSSSSAARIIRAAGGYDTLCVPFFRRRNRNMQRRYVHGPGTDEPLVWYEGAGTSGRRFLHADERGSIVAVSDSAGTVIGVNTYDEYGKPAPANIGRFQYTGQSWLPELQLYYYKHRMYHPNLGRFLQPDPIGYEGGPNLYNYVGSDPVNSTDPSGMKTYKPPENQGGGGHSGGVNWSTGSLFGNCPAGSRCLSNGVDMDVLKMAIDIATYNAINAATLARLGLTVNPVQKASSPTWSNDHDYTAGPFLICQDIQSGCNASTIKSVFPYFVVPNYDGYVANGQISPVYAISGELFQIGSVVTYYSNGGLSARNITLPNHYLRDGMVFIGNYHADNGWYVAAHGQGTNINVFRSWLNQAIGPDIFNASLTSYVSVVRSRLGR